MKYRLPIISLLIPLTLLLPKNAVAQVSAGACQQAINEELAKELRFERAVLFGEYAASGSIIGHVRYDNEGDPWIKIGGSDEDRRWASLKGDESNKLSNAAAADKFNMTEAEAGAAPNGTTRVDDEGVIWIKIVSTGVNEWRAALAFRSDEEVDENAEIEPRRGIFNTKRTLTHELIPYLTQSMRALQCRTQVICDIAMQSMITSPEGGENAVEVVTVELLGCEPMFRAPLSECRFPATEVAGKVLVSEQTGMLDYCQGVRRDLLEREAVLLRFITEYDAAYRTMLQLAGNLDLAIQQLRWPLTNTIRHVASILGQMARIPCFMSACDASPIPFPEVEQ